MYRGAIWSKKCNPKPVPFWSTLLIIFDPFSAFVRSAFRYCSIVFSIWPPRPALRGSHHTPGATFFGFSFRLPNQISTIPN